MNLPAMPQAARHSLLPILMIMLAVAVWGSVHALGTFLVGETYDYRKPLIVLVCVGGFLVFWAAALLVRHRRQSPTDTSPTDTSPVDTSPVDTSPVDTSQIDKSQIDTSQPTDEGSE